MSGRTFRAEIDVDDLLGRLDAAGTELRLSEDDRGAVAVDALSEAVRKARRGELDPAEAPELTRRVRSVREKAISANEHTVAFVLDVGLQCLEALLSGASSGDGL